MRRIRQTYRALITLCLSACSVVIPDPVIPLRVVHHGAQDPAAVHGLVVLLPGLGDGPEDFVEHGIVDAIRRLAPAFDVIAADVHAGYYFYGDFRIAERLRADVIAPARAAGYRDIWLVGISLGGFGALSYAMEHGADIRGVVALAPYLGDGRILDQVQSAGTLGAWSPPAIDSLRAGHLRESYALWSFLQSYVDGRGTRPELFLGWGKQDALGRPAGEIAIWLPPDHVVTIEGGHRWSVWRPLFELVLQRLLNSEIRRRLVLSPPIRGSEPARSG